MIEDCEDNEDVRNESLLLLDDDPTTNKMKKNKNKNQSD